MSFDMDSDDFGSELNGGKYKFWLHDTQIVNFKQDCQNPHPYRLFGPVYKIESHSYEFFSKKKGNVVRNSRVCAKLNFATGKLDMDRACAGCEIHATDANQMKMRSQYLTHAIDRVRQQMGHPNPVVLMQLPFAAMISIHKKKQMNIHGGKPYSMAHPEFGRDIYIQYDGNADPANKYSIERADSISPLQPQERNYSMYNLEAMFAERVVPQLEDQSDFRSFLARVGMGSAGSNTEGMSFGGKNDFGNASFDAPAPPNFGAPTGAAPVFNPPQANSQFQPPQFQIPAPATPPQFMPKQADVPSQPLTQFSAPPQMHQASTFQPPAGFQQPQAPQQQPQVQPQMQPQQSSAAFTAAIAGTTAPRHATLTATGKPACFGDSDAVGEPDCHSCPFMNECFAKATS